MTEFLWPATLTPARSRLTLRDLSSRFLSPFTGTAYAYSRPGGDVVALSIDLPPMTVTEAASFRAFVSKMRGGVNRVWARDHSYRLRGSFSAPELLPNNNFSAGTASWSKSSFHTLTVTDSVMRSTTIGNTASSNRSMLFDNTGQTVTQYAPYLFRVLVLPGRGDYDDILNLRLGSSAGASTYASLSTQSPGAMLNVVAVPYGTTVYASLLELINTSVMVGDFLEVPYISLARCALVDNGTNTLLYSDQFDNAAWTKTRSSISANSVVAPDGSTTADSLIEDATATNTHQIQRAFTVASAAADITGSISVKAGTRTWMRVVLSEATGSTGASVYINLSTGALGTVSTGANWSDQRNFVVDQGNGWYRLHIVARKTNAATSIFLRADLATADAGNTYSGNGTSLAYIWRGSAALSSVPVRGMQTTSAALDAADQTGTSLWLKGLPASSTGLLVPGDQVQIGTELIQVAASLDSNEAGIGYLTLHRPPRTAPDDNDPVIVNDPLGYFMLADSENGWENIPGRITNASVSLIEAPT